MNMKEHNEDTFKVSFSVKTRLGTRSFSKLINASTEDDAFQKSLCDASNLFLGEQISLSDITDKSIQRYDVLELDEPTADDTPLSNISTNIDIADIPYTIYEYLRQINKGRVILNPDFQRNLVWKNVQKSMFIESILLNYPIQPIYLNERKDSTFVVIDGLQRSSTLLSFFNNELSLEGLKSLPEFNGKTYRELPERMQTRIEDKKLTIFQLKPSTPLSVVYDLFYRINTGGTQLNKQEIRNCIYIGKSTDLLKSLAKEEIFKRAIDFGVSSNRMRDREIILRYLSFKWFDYKSMYTGDLSEYLENAMKRINEYSDEKINEMKIDFLETMRKANALWGNTCFRIPTPCTRGSINTSVFESVSLFLSTKSCELLSRNKNKLMLNYEHLLANDSYLDSVISATSSKYKVFTRIKLANEILEKGIE